MDTARGVFQFETHSGGQGRTTLPHIPANLNHLITESSMLCWPLNTTLALCLLSFIEPFHFHWGVDGF